MAEISTDDCPGGARLTALITAVENFSIGRKGGEASQAMLILGPCTPIGSRIYIICFTSHGLWRFSLFMPVHDTGPEKLDFTPIFVVVTLETTLI